MAIEESKAHEVPQLPASAGALIFDASGQLLILKTTYKKGWSVPGGQIEPGESPWEACRRETLEECGLQVERAKLVCVDFLRPRPGRVGGLRVLFDCGSLPAEQLTTIRLQPDEIERYRFAPPSEAVELLTGPVGRRVAATIEAGHFVYLEDGRPVDGVGETPTMNVSRVVPNIRSERPEETRDFFRELLGFEVAMDMGWVLTLTSPIAPSAQVTIVSNDDMAAPGISVEVPDVDAVHAAATEQGLEIVYPLCNEEWGVRRFMLREPSGTVVNVLSHRPD